MIAVEDEIEVAAELIRALRQSELGEDQAAWIARWTSLLDNATIEDAQAAIAALLHDEAGLLDSIRHSAKPESGPRLTDDGERVSRLIRRVKIRRAQRAFLKDWIKQRRMEEYEERKVAAKELKIRLQREGEQLAREAKAQRLEQLERLATTHAKVREYRQAIYAREKAIIRERVAAVIGTVPDARDEVMIVQSAYHLILKLMQRLIDSGIEQPLDDHERHLHWLLQSWLESEAIREAYETTEVPA